MVFLSSKNLIFVNALVLLLTAASAFASDDYERELRAHEGERLEMKVEEAHQGAAGAPPTLILNAETKNSFSIPNPEPWPLTQQEIEMDKSLVDPRTRPSEINRKLTNCPARAKQEWEGKSIRYLACKKDITDANKNLKLERLQNPNAAVMFNTDDRNCYSRNGYICSQPSATHSSTPTSSAQ